jgi:hypothetical protein
MNDKISNIAKQAGWVDWTDDDNWIHPWYSERGYLTLNDLEKFAKLIIDECILAASSDTIDAPRDIKQWFEK